jgi:TRAP-type C4-dicarboxylate transport system substrate-binding protein
MRNLLIGLFLTALLAGCGGAREDRAGGHDSSGPRKLTLAYPAGDTSDLIAFVDAVTRLSHGSLHVDVRPRWRDGELAYETGEIADVRAGKADLGAAASRAWDKVGLREFRALHAPFLIDSYPLEQRVVESPLAARLLAQLRPLGLVGLGILPGTMRRPLGSKSPLLRPTDFKGLEIATQQSDVADKTLRALGAKPVRVAANERPELTRLDGDEQRPGAISGSLLDAKGQYYSTNVDLWPRPLVVFANAGTFASLTPDQQRALKQAATSLVRAQIHFDRNADREATGELCRRGLLKFAHATTADLAALRAAVEPVYSELERDPATRGAIAAIERMKREVGAPPDSLPGCSRSQASTTVERTPLDGVWEMNTPPAAAGTEGLAENWGKWIFVFDRGRFADTQENKDACTWGYGKFTIQDAMTAWSFVDGGGIAPNNAQNKKGEFFKFRWSRFRDTVTLSQWPGAISPTNFDYKPWRLLSETPSNAHFSKRCPPPAASLKR